MNDFKKILTIENEIEAQLLDSILTDYEIPHCIKSFYDSAYTGIYQSQKGWGRVEAPETFRDEIMEIYKNLSSGEEESTETEA